MSENEILDESEGSYSETLKQKDNEIKELKTMFFHMMEKNQEMQEKLLEIASQPKTIIKNQTQNNFNLKNFLNIQCKDAMNLSDFLETIQLSFNDLLYMGDNGFVKSLQNTFIKQLEGLDQEKRPIH